MARVPTAANVSRAPSPSFPGRRVARSVTADSAAGTALSALGEGLGQLTEVFAQQREKARNENRAAALNETLISLPARFEESLIGLQNEAEPGAAGFADSAQESFEETRRGFLEDLGNRYDLRQSDFDFIEQRSAALAAPHMSAAFRFEQDERRRFFGERLGQQIEELALGVRRDPTPSRIDLALTQAMTAIRNGANILTPEQQSDLERTARRSIHLNALESAIERDPGAMVDRLRSGEFDGLTGQGLTTDDFERLTSAAEIEQRRVEAEREKAAKEQRALLRGRVSAGLKDDIAAIRRTGQSAGQVSADDIRAAYSDEPERAEAIIREIEEERTFYNTRQQVALSTPAEDMDILARNAPEGEGFAVEAERQDFLIEAIREKRKALASDPVGYLFQASPAIAQAYQEAQDGPGLRAAVDAAVQEQERLGLPRFERRALSAGQVSQMTAQYAGLADPQGRADWVRAQAELYGEHWPRVFGELVDGGLPGGAAVLASMTRPGQARAAQALAEAQDAGQKGLKDALGAEVAGDIEDAVRDELLAFSQSLAKVPGGTDNANLYRNQITTLALFYGSQGTDPSDAARQAAADVVNNHYTFVGTYRVPIDQDPDMVHASTEDFLERVLPTLQVAAPGSGEFPLTEDETRRQFVTAIQDKGYWITNRDESGLVLLNEQGQSVVLEDGTPVGLLWSEMVVRPEDRALAPMGADSP